jgi:uncharacterized membrane protein
VSELVVSVFRDQYRAPEVLNDLRRRELAWSSDLDEALAVSLDGQGNTRVYLSIDLSKSEAVSWARMWGSLLSSTIFVPLTGSMAEAANGIALFAGRQRHAEVDRCCTPPEAKWWRESLHLSENFRRDVAAVMAPGGSAIFMLLRSARAAVALEQLRDYGDTIVHTSLNNDQDDLVFAMLSDGGEEVNHEYPANGNFVVDSSA